MSAHTDAAGRKGQEVIQRRAQLRRELKSGTVKLADLLREGVPDWLGSMRAERLLCMAPRVREKASSSLLSEAHLSPMQECCRITTRQRLLLADELEKIANLKPVKSDRQLSKSPDQTTGADAPSKGAR